MSLTSINSPEHCIEIFKILSEKEDLDKNLRALRFSANNYYYQNYKNFNEQQVKKIFSFPLFRQNLPEKIFPQLLKDSIANQEIFPVVLTEWLIPQNIALLDKYIDLLHEKKDFKKLNKFVKYRANKIQSVFLQDKNPSEEFINIALNITVKNILHIKNKPFVVNFLKSHNYKIVDIAKAIDFDLNKNQTIIHDDEVRTLIYSRLIDFFTKKDHINSKESFHSQNNDNELDFIMFFKKFPKDYIQLFEEKNSVFLSNQFNKNIEINGNPHAYITNLAQHIYSEKNKNNLYSDGQYLLNNYFSLITKPIVENVFGYETTVEPMEFHLRKRNFDFILPFKNIYNEITQQQQQVFLVAAFKSFSTQKEKHNLIVETLNKVPYGTIDFYCQKLKGELSEEQNNIIDKLISKLKIEENLPQKNIPSTFKKI